MFRNLFLFFILFALISFLFLAQNSSPAIPNQAASQVATTTTTSTAEGSWDSSGIHVEFGWEGTQDEPEFVITDKTERNIKGPKYVECYGDIIFYSTKETIHKMCVRSGIYNVPSDASSKTKTIMPIISFCGGSDTYKRLIEENGFMSVTYVAVPYDLDKKEYTDRPKVIATYASLISPLKNGSSLPTTRKWTEYRVTTRQFNYDVLVDRSTPGTEFRFYMAKGKVFIQVGDYPDPVKYSYFLTDDQQAIEIYKKCLKLEPDAASSMFMDTSDIYWEGKQWVQGDMIFQYFTHRKEISQYKDIQSNASELRRFATTRNSVKDYPDFIKLDEALLPRFYPIK